MPGREYLLKGLTDKDVKAYLEYQIGLATLLGADKERARKELTETVEFEIQLANVSAANLHFRPEELTLVSCRFPCRGRHVVTSRPCTIR